MIRLENISKKYGDNIIFENTSMSFEHQKIKIKGENGVGKSVLLKIIVGYSLPDQGQVYYDTSKEIRKDADFIENAGVSINAPEFMKSWTGMENLLYLANINKKCSQEKIIELAEVFGLKEALKKKYKSYSLGMKQKMRLLQAVMDEPRYLILDEPFDALDEKSKAIARDFLDQYLAKDEKRMLIYTSHSEQDDFFADIIVHIKNYQLV